MSTPLSSYEMQLVTDSKILLTKNRIIQIVCSLFTELSFDYKKELANKILSDNSLVNAKISKGENYLGLPYVIMDYPRQFGKSDIFAIRSFFWWGNFFSITLQIAGDFKQKFAPALEKAIKENYFSGWYISVADNQWHHHFERSNYVALEETAHYSIQDLPFIKLAKKIPLDKWDDAYSFFAGNFAVIIKSLEAYAPIL